MAHATFHFSVGFIVATCCLLPRLLLAWRNHRPLSRLVALWIAASYGLGIWAIVPHLLYRMGASDAIREAGWTYVFIAYPLLHRLSFGGVFLGVLLCGMCTVGQYVCILLALARLNRRSSRPG